MTALLIFISTFVLVFALGFQSLNVNSGHKVAAFFTSFFISGSNLVLFKTVPQAGMFEIGAYLLAGPVAIVCSMWAHERWTVKKSEMDNEDNKNPKTLLILRELKAALEESPMTLKVGKTQYVRADLVDAALCDNFEDDNATLVLAQLLGKQA